jgi:hypothetical protein
MTIINIFPKHWYTIFGAFFFTIVKEKYRGLNTTKDIFYPNNQEYVPKN